ncbi:MAG: hypothetical protein M1828_006791 [Chrysothrix sp. TS-e1954]|nr:MAG: hypothetical protein M1828_006791 [Chrysothrix sp. TS-e1954]
MLSSDNFTVTASRKRRRVSSPASTVADLGPGPVSDPPLLRDDHEKLDSSEDDDDAPEHITAADAQASAKAATTITSRAINKQRTTNRKKRQEANKLLKRQAQNSSTNHTRDKAKTVASSSESPDSRRESGQSQKDNTGASRSGHGSVNLLPKEILTDDLIFDRSPTPEPIQAEPKVPAKRISMAMRQRTSHPKDLQIGPVDVSVLQDLNKLLPPKANGESKSLKTQWLTGIRGPPGSHVQRRQRKQGFWRKH